MKNRKPTSSSEPSSSSRKPHSFSSARKSRWESAPSGPSNPQDPMPRKPSSNLNPRKESGRIDVPYSSSTTGGPGGPPPHLAAGSGVGSPFPTTAQPTYGLQNLERRTIVLADGNVRSYFTLPADYPLEPFGHGFRQESFESETFISNRFCEQLPPLPRAFGGPPREFGLPRDFGRLTEFRSGPPWPAMENGLSSMKRKFPEEDEFAWNGQHISSPNSNLNICLDRSPMGRYDDDPKASKQVRLDGGNGHEEQPVRRGRDEEDLVNCAEADVGPKALKKAFLKFAKKINESAAVRKNYLENGKERPLQCIVCGRSSKEFPDVHELIMHAYSSQNPGLRVNHLGLHRALCVLMEWNYAETPENSKAYQSFSADDASANKEDLIVWPPTVLIHNTNPGKRKDGHMERMGNKEMDMILKDLGFGGGKLESMYGEGHLGITIVKYANTQVGLREAERLADYFEKNNLGRKGWARALASQSGGDEDKNPALFKVEPKSGEKKRIFYGYLATAFDLDKLDFDVWKYACIKSRRGFDPSE